MSDTSVIWHVMSCHIMRYFTMKAICEIGSTKVEGFIQRINIIGTIYNLKHRYYKTKSI